MSKRGRSKPAVTIIERINVRLPCLFPGFLNACLLPRDSPFVSLKGYAMSLAISLVERGVIPDVLTRSGIRRLLKQRLDEEALLRLADDDGRSAVASLEQRGPGIEPKAPLLLVLAVA